MYNTRSSSEGLGCVRILMNILTVGAGLWAVYAFVIRYAAAASSFSAHWNSMIQLVMGG
jgi:hypothetical protein